MREANMIVHSGGQVDHDEKVVKERWLNCYAFDEHDGPPNKDEF